MSSSTLAAGLRCLRGKLASQQHNEQSDEQLLHTFTSSRDDGCFGVLVRRYGPMVLNVCRRVLGHQQDAEDAFQATFLVLARNAASLRKKSALASFLHGTAYRTALKAKQAAARRRKHEQQTPASLPANPPDELLWREVRVLLDEEIARLPEIYRSVFVLCCLENMSQAEAGRRLGLKERTVSNRVADARKRLAQRLARRGVDLTAVLAATSLAASQASALPAGLLVKTVEGAASTGLAEVVPAAVAELVKQTTIATTLSKGKMAAALLLFSTLLGGVGAWTCRSLATAQTTEPPERASTSSSRADQSQKSDPPQQAKGENVTVTGRVLDPDGKPASGARVYVNPTPDLIYPDKGPVVSTTTGNDGRYSLAVPRSKLMVPQLNLPRSKINIVATAKGCGPDWRDVPIGDLSKEVPLQLVKDDVPIEGRILSLEGNPLAGIRVSLHTIEAFPEGDLSRVLRAVQKGTQISIVTEPRWLPLSNAHPAPMATTDVDGRFRLDGIGRERIAKLHVEGPGIHYNSIEVMTHQGESVRGPDRRDPIYAATFVYLAKPGRLIHGMVREKGTGKPIPGIRMTSHESTASALTDAQGRYELPGCAKGERYGVLAFPIRHQPYFFTSNSAKDTAGLGPLTAHLEMVRGIPFEGKLLDGETGKPVRGHISYYPLAPNPNVTDNLGGGAAWTVGPYSEASVAADGSFRCIVLPGPGFIGVQARPRKRYMSACVDPTTIGALHNKEMLAIPFGGGSVTGTTQEQFQGILLVNPAKDCKAITETMRLAVAPEIKGALLDPEGKPVTGARVRGLEESYSWGTLATEKFRITGVNPERPRKVTFIHNARRLIGSVEVKGTETKPLTVRMQPWAAVRGRLVDAEGRPLREVVLHANQFLPENGRTDRDGRFLLEGLLPGRTYNLTYQQDKPFTAGDVIEGFVGKPGEVRDLGDVRGKPFRQE